MGGDYTYGSIKNFGSRELVNAIRDALNRITSGKNDRAVMLKNLMVSLPDRKKYGWTNYFFLHSVFAGGDGRVCGDLVSVSRSDSREFLFGKDLESLGRDELAEVLLALGRGLRSLGGDDPAPGGPSGAGPAGDPRKICRKGTPGDRDQSSWKN